MNEKAEMLKFYNREVYRSHQKVSITVVKNKV